MTGAKQLELDSFLAGHPEIENFDLLLPDINGILRGVRTPRADMQQVFESGAYMSASTMLLDSRGLLPEGLEIGLADGDPDYPCLPVPGTLAPVPWSSSPAGQCLVQMYKDRSRPYYYDSRQVLQRVLTRFDELGLTPGKKTKTGYSTDAQSLEKMRGEHPIVDHLLAYREIEKLRSTYGEGLVAEVGEGNRIRATFNQTVARTGRLSSAFDSRSA